MDRLRIHTDDMEQAAKTLRAGDKILLSGTIYTARDAAHKRLFGMLDKGEPLPFTLKNASIYYAGPTPAPDHLPIGACGPTTSSRMDVFAPRLLDLGLKCMIGKGGRSPEVMEAIRRNQAVYLCAIGGAGALAAKCIRSVKVLAFEDLGCESVKELQIEDFPLFTAIDCCGGSLFEV
ncbi:FumA C-terminus/TtdB family hydratase beta subunit [Caproiciproducens faecalis]|uniref:Fumarate hydratase C-terminal domain-containing protein n=1 Tax=Caproiciproducens faecalis TaxID=2820301 RepID=A0ABS7DK84_9FIRM|nr:FumA C-terminus/TtdB family hydratase beta subunit [Caproiciproducens faecalis]MBW7571683.1 fumarate hydratase C-terminal domain-containing protein [Caproiciproducens faecalis]